jgi:hypothetical protein
MDKLTQNEHAIDMRKNPQKYDKFCNSSENKQNMAIMYCRLFDRLKKFEDKEDEYDGYFG